MHDQLVRISAVLLAERRGAHCPGRPRQGVRSGDLPSDLDAILADARLDGATVGVVVRDARTGAVKYSRGATTSVLPASNLKIYTSSAALSLLGTGYRFHTDVLARKVSGSSVTGDLYLKGTGDPTMRAAEYDRLAAQVAAKGIKRVEGDLVADDTWFDDVRTPSHWDPTDLQYYYAAPISALNVAPNDDFDTGSINVTIAPGEEGEPVQVGLAPRPTSSRSTTGRSPERPARRPRSRSTGPSAATPSW